MAEPVALRSVADLIVVLRADDEPAARQRLLRPGHCVRQIPHSAVIGVVAGSFAGQPRVHGVVHFVTPLGVEAVASRVG